jgi:hypothetical protein
MKYIGPIKPVNYRTTRGFFTPKYADNDDKKHRSYSPRTFASIKQLLQSSFLASVGVMFYKSIGRKARPNTTSICGRPISIDLSKPLTWPTPYTPSYHKPTSDKDVVLLKKDSIFGGYAQSINGFMHALDVAYDKKCPVYVTNDADWLWGGILPLIYGGTPAEMADDDWALVEQILGVKVVSPHVILTGKQTYVHGAQASFYVRGSELNDVNMIRNRRDTIWRNILHYSGRVHPTKVNKGDSFKDVCSFVNSAAEDQNARVGRAQYAVLDVSFDTNWLGKLQESTSLDHKPASEMSPDYVKSILGPLNLLEKPIYIIGSAAKVAPGIQALRSDATLSKVIKDLPNHEGPQSDLQRDGGGIDIREIHLAVMADAYLGDPTSHKSLIVAKMRYALGRGNTYVFTVKGKDGKWVDALDGRYGVLYDKSKMGLWMG